MTGQARQAAATHACEPFELRIRRFARSYRRRIRKLVRGSKPLMDLLYSFPAAAFVLAAGKPQEDCARALALVKAGEPLAAVAKALGLPLWARRLPPEAFSGPMGRLPGDEQFDRQIVNLLPTPGEAAAWLRSIVFAGDACSNGFALWLAGRRVIMTEGGALPPLLPLAAFCWFSRHKNHAAHQLIEAAWHKNAGFYKVVWETRAWLERVVIDHCLEDHGASTPWHKERKSCGYRFVPLRSAEELREEGDRMRNCVATYAAQVAAGVSLIYSIRRGGARVATLEVVAAPRYAQIAQLFGPENTPVPEDVRRAAAAWLGKRSKYPAVAALNVGQLPIRADRWAALWEPYCAAKPQFRPLLQGAPAQALGRLHADLCELERWQEPR